jgi:RNA polymerase sigma-70 factor (ECF subfamily)
VLPAIAPPAGRAVFAELVERYEREIYAFLFRMVRHEADAQDLLQETFLRALRAYPRLDDGANHRAWLYRIATNTALNHLRQRGRESTGMEDQLLNMSSGQEEAEMRHMDLVSAVTQALQALPPKQRAALIQRKFHDLCYEAIAANIGSTPDAARANVYQALRKIKTALGREP